MSSFSAMSNQLYHVNIQKDLVLEAEDDGCLTKGKSSLDLSLPPAATRIWKNHLDLRLKAECEPSGTPGPGAWPAGLPGSLDLAGLACCCLAPRKKRRPPMNEVCTGLLLRENTRRGPESY